MLFCAKDSYVGSAFWQVDLLNISFFACHIHVYREKSCPCNIIHMFLVCASAIGVLPAESKYGIGLLMCCMLICSQENWGGVVCMGQAITGGKDKN